MNKTLTDTFGNELAELMKKHQQPEFSLEDACIVSIQFSSALFCKLTKASPDAFQEAIEIMKETFQIVKSEIL